MPKAVPADPALAAAIQRLRHQAGLTQEDLAFASGLTIASVSRVECAITNPAWSTIRCLTAGLGITLRQLITAIENQEDPSQPAPVPAAFSRMAPLPPRYTPR